ncbi:MAG: alanine--tRNA ligase, partial [Pseudomonadota bacterium]|nr:alanine--tRNA ligase [Pseudomonadota bacterium]
GQAYPEIVRAEALIEETLRLEETRFRRTLARGLQILDEETAAMGQGATLSGEVAFKLYDTYGFPLDLTQDALRPRGIKVDTAGFNAAMERQRAEARSHWAGSGETQTERLWFDLREKVGATEFLGYETETAEGVVVALVANGAEVPALAEGDEGIVVLNQTPFYGASGGQVGDTGEMRGDGVLFRVTDTQKKVGDLLAHYGRVEKGRIETGQPLTLEVDHARRGRIRSNHSATHLLHEALREVLGTHVAQKGSLVEPERLRFDFSHPKPVADQELAAIEDLANSIVLQNAPVMTHLMSVDEAIEAGAMALFGEKYGDEVRVVSMGTATQGPKAGKTYSMELCGGTHVARTGDIGLVTVVQEGAVAAGVRRIEALTGEAARHHLADQARRVRSVADELKVSPGQVVERVHALVEERRRLERELAEARRRLAMGGGPATDTVREVAGVRFLGRVAEGVSSKDLRGLVDEGKKRIGSGVVAIVGVSEEGKAGIAVGVTEDLVGRFNAVELVRAGAAAMGGQGGGGRPDMAQAGGPDGTKAEAALQAVEAQLAGHALAAE